MASAAWDVYLNNKLIDTVFYDAKCDGGATVTADDVRRSLIDHDGYDARIVVQKQKSRKAEAS